MNGTSTKYMTSRNTDSHALPILEEATKTHKKRKTQSWVTKHIKILLSLPCKGGGLGGSGTCSTRAILPDSKFDVKTKPPHSTSTILIQVI